VFQLIDPIEGRADGAWVIQYHGEDFLTDPGGGNPEPFSWSDQAHQAIDFPVKTREEIAGQLRLNPAKLALVQRSDPAFPAPIVTFRDGSVWSAAAIDAWAPTQAPVPTRERGVPKG
ncbi:MAG: hypothetical protein ACXWXR_04575, partial [Candidatus Limnocylindrales bacterium]